MTREELALTYHDYLSSEGYHPEIDSDGDVTFKYEGGFYVVICSDDDEYFRIVYPNFWSVENERERIMADRACIKATAETKVAKVFTVNDSIWASIEMFCSSPEHAKQVFPRCLRALRASVRTFVEAMQA